MTRVDVRISLRLRAKLIQAVASKHPELEVEGADTAIRDRLLAHLSSQRWANTAQLNATVNNGIAELWGMTGSDAERQAIRVAVESTPGLAAVNDHLVVRTHLVGT